MRSLIATVILLVGSACAESMLLDAQPGVHGDAQASTQPDADAAQTADSGAQCCPVQSLGDPRCDCVPIGGIMRLGETCATICDSHPATWRIVTDPSGCPTLVWDQQRSCNESMDASTSSTADAG